LGGSSGIAIYLNLCSPNLAHFKGTRYIYAKPAKAPKIKHWTFQTLAITGLVFFYFLGMRSSLGTFPLQTKNSVISSDDFINKCVPNGIYTLKEALKEISNEFAPDTPGGLLHAYGYKSISEVVADYYEIPKDSVISKNLDSLIFKRSSGICLDETETPPHIVWLIMESMSNHFLEFHSSQMNLLGKLEPHWKEGIVFRNFQSSGNGTVTALENTIFNTPYHILFESRYRHRHYPTSLALPFKQAGYNTAFITGIELGWRHMNEVLPEQGFDDCAGRATILNELPGAEANKTWGVFDHHLFRFIEQKLQKSSTPQFVLSLSSTNHTPYELPHDYKPFSLVLSDSVENAFTTPKERSEEILRGYQYANSSIGSFMNQLKADSLLNNTIVIVTGDHNVRSLLPYNTPENAPFKFQVPLFIHIPDKYKQQLHIDTERFGSHYDILTSIAPYFLKGASYLNLGQDLFDAQTPTENYYSINDARVQAPKEGLSRAKEKAKLRRIIQRYYFTKLFGIK
jgi:phosphoglycerol transferase MdoB-like AlkP superfamily enzyme